MRPIFLVPIFFTFSPAMAEGLPDNFDFRKVPAFIRLDASIARTEAAQLLIRDKCPEQIEYERIENQISAMREEDNALRKKAHRTMPKISPGDEYAKIFKTKLQSDPRHLELEAQIEANQKKIKRTTKALNPAYAKQI